MQRGIALPQMWQHVPGLHLRAKLLYEQLQRLGVSDQGLARTNDRSSAYLREFRAMNATIQLLQEQVDNLYAHLHALRQEPHSNNLGPQEHSIYPPPPPFEAPGSQSYHHDGHSPPQSRGKHPQYQGPTSTAFNFDIANASLRTMGVTEPEISDGNAVAFDESLADPQLQAPVASMAVHPNKDPLWRMTKEDAIRLCRIYEDEMGFLYPVVNIDEIIERAKFLFTFTEAATRSGLVRADRSGPDTLATADNNILKIVLATALTVETNGRSDLGHALFDSVKEASESRLWEPAELKGLVLLVITVSMVLSSGLLIYTYTVQAQYHFHTDDEIRAYRIIGLAARFCLEMGLHRKEIVSKTLLSTEERFQACKLFWSIYVLDRRWSFGTGMPFAIQDADIDPTLHEPVRAPLRSQFYMENTRLIASEGGNSIPNSYDSIHPHINHSMVYCSQHARRRREAERWSY